MRVVNIKNFQWYIKVNDIINQYNKAYFESTKITGEQLYDKIKNDDAYIINLDLRGGKYITEEIQKFCTYEEFEESNCEICVIVIDCTYVEIYFKDRNNLIRAFNYYEYINLNPKYITDNIIRKNLEIF